MIGILMSLVSWGYAAADGIKRAVYTNDGYKRGLKRREEGTDITNSYFDWQGIRRDLDTGHPISVDFAIAESNGRDRCIKDLQTGKIIRNLTEEKRQETYRYAQTHNYSGNRTVCLYKEKYNDNDFLGMDYKGNYCGGSVFKDLHTGELYVARNFIYKYRYWREKDNFIYVKDGSEYHKPGCGKEVCSEATFYMNMDGYLIRESDTDKMKRKNGDKSAITEKEAHDFIELFNDKQRHNGWKGTRFPKRDMFGNIEQESKCEKKYRKEEYYCNRNAVYTDV